MPERWTAESIPPELVAIHDAPGGASLPGLAEILNAYDGLRDGWACALAEEALAIGGDSFDVAPGISLKVDDRVPPGFVVAVGANVGALDTATGRIAIIDRERQAHLAARIREGIAAAERGETVDLGSFAQYLEDDGDD